jgi:16S rRNA (guanine966-N2)-methyltransferase
VPVGGGVNVRIVGGIFRGRRLKAPEGALTRPTSEKVREALFDILGTGVKDSLFVDLFAGTGAVGLEALSRGAGRAILVEAKGPGLASLRWNADSLAVDPDRCRILPVPVKKALALLGEEGARPDIVFCDPPYSDERWPALLAEIGRCLDWPSGGLLVVEHASKKAPVCPEGFDVRRSYRYGDTGLTVFEKKG